MVTGDGAFGRGGDAAPGRLTIDEVSRRTGMSVRNIRAHQSRGLLPRPQRQGRVGYYTAAHVERILRIQQLQAQGFNLASIAAALDGATDGTSDHRALQRIALAPLLRHDSMVVKRRALSEMFNHPRSDENLRLAEELGLLRQLSDGTIELSSRQLAAAAQELILLGFGAEEVLELQARLLQATREVAERFVELCLRRAWDPFADEGYPAEHWRTVRRAFERLQEQAAVVLLGTFAMTVRSAVERRIAEHPVPTGT